MAWDEHSEKYLRNGTIDGQPVPILVDTGADRTMVAAHVVKRTKITRYQVLCINVCLYPTVEVSLAVGSWEKRTPMAVAPNLPVPVLLGRDIYREDTDVPDKPAIELAVITRSQTRQLEKMGDVAEATNGPCRGNNEAGAERG